MLIEVREFKLLVVNACINEKYSVLLHTVFEKKCKQ